ncbi:DUF2017 domain-containing protein [Saccharopolyspora gregorii]|uniref:DUF2017 domain-containing protein n=1 Tax=Saccharopolyspora gregorii TaxID=33914 RepID=A0ABP6RRD0_9PSEU
MNGWTRKNGHVVAELSQQEAAVIRGLVGQIKDMLTARAEETPQDELAELTGIRTGPSTPPEDRVLGRLLPDFYRRDPETGETDEEQPEAAGAMRSLYEPELLDVKTGVAAVVLDTCPAKAAGRAQRRAGRQLDGRAQRRAARARHRTRRAGRHAGGTAGGRPAAGAPRVYQWLTWVQDSLVDAVSS